MWIPRDIANPFAAPVIAGPVGERRAPSIVGCDRCAGTLTWIPHGGRSPALSPHLNSWGRNGAKPSEQVLQGVQFNVLRLLYICISVLCRPVRPVLIDHPGGCSVADASRLDCVNDAERQTGRVAPWRRHRAELLAAVDESADLLARESAT